MGMALLNRLVEIHVKIHKLIQSVFFYIIQVYQNLQPLHICMSYQTTLNILDRISEDHDVEVQFWSDELKKCIEKPPDKVRSN